MTASRNPCQYSPEVLDVIADELAPHGGAHVHDPFAGPGTRLGALCDALGLTFSGTDIEEWPGHDPRVTLGDAADPTTYPARPFFTTTSPVYVNKRCCDPNGPTPITKTKGRRDYGIALGRALHPDNLARTTGRPAKTPLYWAGHAQAVKHWGDEVILNVDQPIAAPWCDLLVAHGYEIARVLPAYTQRYGGLNNAEKRAEYEVVIVAHRAP